MTAQQHLLGYGVTMGVARDFIMNNLSNLNTVYSTCKNFGVNNDMIAEILQADFPGVNGTIVSNFFDTKGFSGAGLGFTNSSAGTGTPSAAIPSFSVGLLSGHTFYQAGNQDVTHLTLMFTGSEEFAARGYSTDFLGHTPYSIMDGGILHVDFSAFGGSNEYLKILGTHNDAAGNLDAYSIYSVDTYAKALNDIPDAHQKYLFFQQHNAEIFIA
ncbi:MAG: hypothetical protein NTZ60_01095 [Campylobacterales bacterium]|nr:hypothetical protein [Campylobacterales bacterium]